MPGLSQQITTLDLDLWPWEIMEILIHTLLANHSTPTYRIHLMVRNNYTSIFYAMNLIFLFFSTDTYPTHSGESFCSSEISLDDSTNFEPLDESASDSLSLQTLEPVPPPPSLEGHGLTAFGPVNPIDKLYLMQNSYFSTEQWHMYSYNLYSSMDKNSVT